MIAHTKAIAALLSTVLLELNHGLVAALLTSFSSAAAAQFRLGLELD